MDLGLEGNQNLNVYGRHGSGGDTTDTQTGHFVRSGMAVAGYVQGGRVWTNSSAVLKPLSITAEILASALASVAGKPRFVNKPTARVVAVTNP
jgi:hypothetical protein